MISALTEAMSSNPEPWVNGTVLPNLEVAASYRVMAQIAYPRIKEIIEQTVASELIYINSHSSDWSNDEIRPMMERFMCGSNGYTGEQRVKLMKLLWDATGSEFGGRHELYERNFVGNNEATRFENVVISKTSGRVDQLKAFADCCMAEYELKGWTVPDLINPDDVSYHTRARRA